MAGYKKAYHLSLKELWVTDGAAPDYFRAARSGKCFILLLRALPFDKLGDKMVRN